jgi:microcystin-dependent protein
MAEPYLGQLATFAFSFTPRGWAPCNGQLMSISQNSALFSLIGTFYGGDGVTTFGVPDLRGRVAIHQGTGPGLQNYSIGEETGTENVTLTVQQMPQHTHPIGASSGLKTTNRATGAVNARGGNYGTAPGDVAMAAPQAMGGSQPHSNLQPLLVVNWCICVAGIFPSRN